MRGLRSCGAGDGEPQPELTEMRLLPLLVLNIRGAFAVSCPDVHLGTGRMPKRASRKSPREAEFPVWLGPAAPRPAKGRSMKRVEGPQNGV